MFILKELPPDKEPIELKDLKNYLRIDEDIVEEGSLLKDLISAARHDFERSTNMILMEHFFQIKTDIVKNKELPIFLFPIQNIEILGFDAQNKQSFVIDSTKYEWHNKKYPNILRFSNIRAMNAQKVEIKIQAGFAKDTAEIPKEIQQAIMLLAAHWYEFRTGFFTNGQQAEYPLIYQKIVNNYRMRRL